MDALKAAVFDAMKEHFVRAELFIPYEKSAEFRTLRPLLYEGKNEYLDDGESLSAVIPIIYADKFKEFVRKSL